MAFQTSTTFTDFAGLIRKMRDSLHKQYTSKVVKDLDPLSPDYKTRVIGELGQLYLFTHALRFFAERFREVAASKKLDLYFVAALAFTVLLTVIVFGFEYWAVERLSSGSFQSRGPLSLVAMFGYSFATLMHADVAGIIAIAPSAIVLSYLELFAALILLVILVFVILTIVRERYREDMDKVVGELDSSAVMIQNALESQYKISLTDAEIALLAVDAAMLNWIRKLRGLDALEPPIDTPAK